MGITPISCKCVKSCGEKPEELDLANGKYLRSRSGNFRFNNEGNRVEKYPILNQYIEVLYIIYPIQK